MKRVLAMIMVISAALFTSCGGQGANNSHSPTETDRVTDERGLDPFEFSLMNLAATDAAGRRVDPMLSRKGDADHSVGIFYSVWLGGHAGSGQSGIYDVEALLSTAEGREALADMSPDNPKSPLGQFHFSSKPLYGYYNMEDPWVVARHVELLTACGLDYLCIDATNAVIYQKATGLLLDTLLKFGQQGFNVPKVMFYTNSESGTTVTRLYNEYYQTEKYNGVWWAPFGKPMIVGITENSNRASDQTMIGGFSDYVTPAMQEFFDVQESQWPQAAFNDDAFPWMDWQYPQMMHNKLSMVSVSVAQHSPSGIYMSLKHNYSSRGFDHETKTLHEDWEKGQNFQSEWNTVFADERVKNVLVTGWNEWMAIKGNNGGAPGFVDAYNEEYSRDCEMSAGKYGDNFYLQLMQNVRRFKFNSQKSPFVFPKTAIDIDNETLVQWNYVYANYKDFAGDAIARDYFDAAKKDRYTDNSNRNDVTDIKVAHSSEYLFFYVKTLEPVTPYNGVDENWMNILISTGSSKGFEGYDFIVNRKPNGNKTSVEKSAGGYNWAAVGEADYRIFGNVMLYRIPLKALGLSADDCHIEFKVADNVTNPYDIMDYYVSGESAPIGRLSFNYGR